MKSINQEVASGSRRAKYKKDNPFPEHEVSSQSWLQHCVLRRASHLSMQYANDVMN